MIKHLFKIIWQGRKKNFLLMLEFFISFLVLFAIFCVAYNLLLRYNKPLGFNSENVWVLKLNYENTPDSIQDKNSRFEQLISDLSQIKGINQIAKSGRNFPYAQNTFISGLESKKTGESVQSNIQFINEHFKDVMGLRLTEGRWFSDQDDGISPTPIVIDEGLKEALFGNQPALGEIVNGNWKVIGVTDKYRIKGEFSEYMPVCFQKTPSTDLSPCLLIKVKPGSGIELEEKIMKAANYIARDWNVEFDTVVDMRKTSFNLVLVPLLVFAIVTIFLILNVIMGLFGVLWYNISRRRSEIGLRRSVGAQSIKLFYQFIGEMLVLASLGILPGFLIVLQFTIINLFKLEPGASVLSILTSIVAIYVLVIVCAAIPSFQASKIQPAQALSEE